MDELKVGVLKELGDVLARSPVEESDIADHYLTKLAKVARFPFHWTSIAGRSCHARAPLCHVAHPCSRRSAAPVQFGMNVR